MLDGSIEREFGGETRRFRLTIGALERLESAFGPFLSLFQQVQEGSVSAMAHILTRGLEGGGMPLEAARELVGAYVPGRVPAAQALAGDILGAAFDGMDDIAEPEDDPEGEAGPARTEPTSRDSTGQAGRSGRRRRKSRR